jgi:hypothetical protein
MLGLELLHVEASTEDEPEAVDGEELAGGSLCSERIDAGTTDRYMGFTNGREADE